MDEITIDEFARIDLRVGTIRTAEAHPNADRLVVLSVDVGDAEPRQIVAGIRRAYDPETLVGRQIVVVVNLKPATLRGMTSQGMLLAANDESLLSVVAPDKEMRPGSRVK
jgi:methionyl-tRNA synthetase